MLLAALPSPLVWGRRVQGPAAFSDAGAVKAVTLHTSGRGEMAAYTLRTMRETWRGYQRGQRGGITVWLQQWVWEDSGECVEQEVSSVWKAGSAPRVSSQGGQEQSGLD